MLEDQEYLLFQKKLWHNAVRIRRNIVLVYGERTDKKIMKVSEISLLKENLKTASMVASWNKDIGRLGKK